MKLNSVSEISEDSSVASLTCYERCIFAKWFAFPQVLHNFCIAVKFFKCLSTKSLPHLINGFFSPLYFALSRVPVVTFFVWIFLFESSVDKIIGSCFILELGFIDDEAAPAINELF